MKRHSFILIIATLSIVVQASAQTDSQRQKDKKAQSRSEGYVTATHDSLNRLGAELLRRVDAQKLYAEIYSPEHIVELRRGGIDEDDHTFGLGCDAGRFYKHFFQPASGFGLYSETSGTYCISAVAWARFSDDELTWSGAISSYDYSPSAKLQSYLRLGHVAHLVGDMAQPDHVHLEPHPLSFITDYEGWVVDNWDDIAPDIKKLSPRKRAVMEDHLREMADITYPLSSFFGDVLRRDVNNPIDQSTELAKMFNVGYSLIFQQWTLNNRLEVDPNEKSLGDWDGTYSSDDNFWETTAETGHGESGYFTIEDIADAIPAEFENVANTDRRKLGYFYATKLLPLAVEYIAGLYEHFYEVVNHPPYVSKVSISKNGTCVYAKQWQDIFNGDKLEKRDLIDVCSTPESNRSLVPGEKIEIEIEFSGGQYEPTELMQDIDVQIGSLSISGQLINDRFWRTEFTIPVDCSLLGEQAIKISARDRHEHYANRNELGDKLDGRPDTPAKASRDLPYDWTGYEVVADMNHHIEITDSHVDIALVIDRSGSMAGIKLAGAKTAAKTFVDVMQDCDQIAVTSFSSSASVNYPLTRIAGAATKTVAKNAINSLGAAGGTSIGGGMQAGQGQLNNGDPNHPHAMLLLSDGIENSAPFVANVLPTIPQATDIYTIGLGADVDPTQLQNIANTTGGLYRSAPSSTDLQEIYLRIQGQIKGQQTTSSFTGTIAQGQTAQHSTMLDALTTLATFTMTFQGSDVDLELVAPNGTIINPQVALADPNITYLEGGTLDSYTITQPQPGTWTLRLLGVDVPVPENYFAIVQVNSTLKMAAGFDKPKYEAGEPILISANLQANGQAILNATVTANVDAPTTSMLAYREARADYYRALEKSEAQSSKTVSSRNGVEHVDSFMNDDEKALLASSSLNLFDDGAHGDGAANDGLYANYFTNTLNDGSYTFTILASGIATPGGIFTRESVVSTVVTPSSRVAVVSITPNTGQQGQTLSVSILGNNFAAGANVTFSGTGFTTNSTTFVNSTQLAANVTIAANASVGPRDVIVTNPNGAVATGPVLFSVTGCASNLFVDEFSDGDALGWTPNVASRWQVTPVGGDLAYCITTANSLGNEYTVLSQNKLGDFVFDVKAKATATTNKNFFIMFGVQDFTNSPEDSYYLRFGSGNAGVDLFRSVANNGVVIAHAPDNFVDDNQYHVIRIELRGQNIMIYGDRRLLFSVNDITHMTGHIGFGSFQSTACFDNVQVSGCPDLAVGPVIFSSYLIDDNTGGASIGDGDSRPERGERVELTMELTNTGLRSAFDVSAILWTSDPDVTIFDDNNIWPNIAPGLKAFSLSNFGFEVNSTLQQDKDVTFNLSVIAANGGSWTQSFSVRVYYQDIQNPVADLVADRVFLRTGPNSGSEVTNPVAGQRYYIHFDWRNAGATAANGFRFEIRFNGSVIYSFSSADAPGNSIHNSYGPSPVIWPAGGGVISGALDVHNQVTEAAKNNNAAFRTFGYQSFDDFDFTAQVRSIENFNNNGGADLCFVYGYQDDRHYYFVMFNRGLNETRVYKVRDLERILIGDLGTFTIPDNNYHNVRLLRRSGNLQVYWDNVLLGGTSNDHEYGAGGIGVGSFNDTGIFDDICVKLPGGSTCLVSDNFEDGNANGWLPLNPARWDVIVDGGDRGYRINDTNYENLEYLRLGEYSLMALTGQADLVAQRIYLRNSAGTEVDVPVAGQSYTVSFQWQNLGTAVANNIPVEVRLNGNVLCTANVTANPGDTKITSCPPPVTFNPGNYFFESTVDVGNLITESNENNNSISRTIIVPDTCVPTTCTGPALFPVPQGATVIGTPITGRTGSMICIDIRMQNNAQPVDAFGFQVQVNPGQLAFVNAVAGDLTTGFTSVNANESPASSGRIICGGFGTTAIPTNRSGVLIRLCFTVTCAVNESSLITLNSLSDDVAGMNTCCNTFACATCESNGDVNNDGSLSPGDALCAFNIYLNGGRLTTACDVPNFTCEVEAADVNCDGAVTPSDALAIFTRYLQGGLPQHCFAKTVVAKSSGAPYRLALKQSQMILSGNTREELLKLTLRIDNPEGLRAMGLRLSYPADKVEPLAVQRTALTAKWVKLEGQSLWPGQMIIGGYDPEALPNSGAADLLEVLFKVKAQPVRAEEFGLSELIDDLMQATVLVGEAGELAAGGVPRAFQLHQSYPNPFGSAQGNLATIRFEVPGSEAVKMELAIYNLAGQLVRQLLTGVRAPGAFEIIWDGNDEAGNPAPSGTYLYRLRAGNQVAGKSLVLVR